MFPNIVILIVVVACTFLAVDWLTSVSTISLIGKKNNDIEKVLKSLYGMPVKMVLASIYFNPH